MKNKDTKLFGLKNKGKIAAIKEEEKKRGFISLSAN